MEHNGSLKATLDIWQPPFIDHHNMPFNIEDDILDMRFWYEVDMTVSLSDKPLTVTSRHWQH